MEEGAIGVGTVDPESTWHAACTQGHVGGTSGREGAWGRCGGEMAKDAAGCGAGWTEAAGLVVVEGTEGTFGAEETEFAWFHRMRVHAIRVGTRRSEPTRRCTRVQERAPRHSARCAISARGCTNGGGLSWCNNRGYTNGGRERTGWGSGSAWRVDESAVGIGAGDAELACRGARGGVGLGAIWVNTSGTEFAGDGSVCGVSLCAVWVDTGDAKFTLVRGDGGGGGGAGGGGGSVGWCGMDVVALGFVAAWAESARDRRMDV
mmetsp:Transcript_28463/g.46141  ORF Transcript_28463/g.46141 Transcript_28463/m.46141 type:complete len:262 (-) Transcript_28463:818-1603(-)